MACMLRHIFRGAWQIRITGFFVMIVIVIVIACDSDRDSGWVVAL